MSEIRHWEHNYQACEFLLESEKFNDWVITTAFYSALHLLQEELFPNVYEEREFVAFPQYHKYLKDNNKTNSKHESMLQLVSIEKKEVSSQYHHLHDICMKARYNNYCVSPKKAKVAKSYLEKIIGEVKKEATKKTEATKATVATSGAEDMIIPVNTDI